MTTPDTIEINNLWNALPDGGTLELDRGRVYMIDPRLTMDGSVRLTGKGKTLLMNGATLQAIPNDFPAYAVLRIGIGALDPSEARIHQDITVKGPGLIRGDRDAHTGTTGEQGMCIWNTNTANASVEDVICENAWGDGWYSDQNDGMAGTLGGAQYRPDGTTVTNLTARHNRRNGASLVGAAHTVFATPRFLYNGLGADGKRPGAGIDLEPDFAGTDVDHTTLIGMVSRGNAGAGFEVADTSPGMVRHVTLIAPTITGNQVFGVKVVGIRGGFFKLIGGTVAYNTCDNVYIEAREGIDVRQIVLDGTSCIGALQAIPDYTGGPYGGTVTAGYGLRLHGVPKAAIVATAMGFEGNALGGFVWDNAGSQMYFGPNLYT